ncbi:MAG: dihydroxyacetone kinase subunit DhaL [Betaproteobacteria bacterium]
MNSALIVDCIAAVRGALLASERDIESLDRALGDGDHFINVKRGCDVLLALSPELLPLAPDAACRQIGMKLMSTIGGASGPLLASFFLALGKSIAGAATVDAESFARAFAAGVDAIGQRGKSGLGEKTMLDVLIPVANLLQRLTHERIALDPLCAQVKAEAERSMLATRDMIATKGRAHFLGERAIGHIDPGSKTCQVAIHAVCDLLTSR